MSSAYIENQITSSTPQQLRLLLIEGGLRFARRTLEQWQAGDVENAAEPLARARAILAELMAAVQPDPEILAEQFDSVVRDRPLSAADRQEQLARLQDIAHKTMGLYVFMFRSLTEAQLSCDCDKLQAVVDLLEIERDTAAELCRQAPVAVQLGERPQPKEITADPAPATAQAAPSTYGSSPYQPPASAAGDSGVSFEA